MNERQFLFAMEPDVYTWLASRLTQWHDHYLQCENCEDEPTAMPVIIERLHQEAPLTQWEYEIILFHLWQEATHETGKDEELAAVEKADEVMRELFKDRNLCLVRELLEEWFRKRNQTTRPS